MATMKRNVIALNLPQSVPLLIVFGRHVVLAFTGNASLPSPVPSLDVVTQHLDALEAAEVGVQNRTKGAAAARDRHQKLVEDDLIALKAYAQHVANQHPEQAEAIIASAGMTHRRNGRAPKAALAAAMGPGPAAATLRAKAIRRGAAYEWQYSADSGGTWLPAGTTTVAKTRVSNLSPGATYLFRFRTTVKQTTGDWSQSISFLVH